MRINKYIATAGVCSRRAADNLIINGAVRVNGAVMRTPGYDVLEGDIVSVNGREINAKTDFVYFALNKPVGYVTTLNDEANRPTVRELMTDRTERLFPVGRLDYNTSGLLIMTNDGELAEKLMHPSRKVHKTYRALVSGVVSDQKIARLRTGVDIGGYITKPAVVKIIRGNRRTTLLEISICEGKNRQIRKMCNAIGNNLEELERISIGDIVLGRTRSGDYRRLNAKEMEYLRSL
ncbi:MAG: rRNA pseudouridine synthase [Enterococcus sp.]|nr:rRNA pseudouridine synthase [Enterococcus sp.]